MDQPSKAQDLLFGRRRSSFTTRYIEARPATLVSLDGSQQWLDDSKRLHRVEGPALVLADGSSEWYQRGKLHRLSGPAIIKADGSEEWFLAGKRHRPTGPALTTADGSKHWYFQGMRHRTAGPAVIEGKLIEYYQFGQLHRFSGPALICQTNKGERREWWHYGQFVKGEFV